MGQGKSGAFGPPSLAGYKSRDFAISDAGCNVPSTVKAYSLNMTVVPTGPLDFLSTWPAGQNYPGVSTLNSPTGTIIANASIVSSGSKSAVSVVGGQNTDLIIDVNGYFWPPGTQELLFFPITPCRLVDTRLGQGKSGLFGPPSLTANVTRVYPVLTGGCNIPATAKAFSMNITAVPAGRLGYVAIWSTGQANPGVSTLNSPDGSTVANAALVTAGQDASVTMMSSDATDLIVDINGFFAPPTTSAGGLHFYPMTPCRVVDTRVGQNKTGSFGPPQLAANQSRIFPFQGQCGMPASAAAYSLNLTAVPPGSLDYLSVWPAGQPYPGVSTLNSPTGRVIANAAIVPAGTNGAITVAAGKPTDLIIDINGYFAP
jgi:hypothetical protein